MPNPKKVWVIVNSIYVWETLSNFGYVCKFSYYLIHSIFWGSPPVLVITSDIHFMWTIDILHEKLFVHMVLLILVKKPSGVHEHCIGFVRIIFSWSKFSGREATLNCRWRSLPDPASFPSYVVVWLHDQVDMVDQERDPCNHQQLVSTLSWIVWLNKKSRKGSVAKGSGVTSNFGPHSHKISNMGSKFPISPYMAWKCFFFAWAPQSRALRPHSYATGWRMVVYHMLFGSSRLYPMHD